jgi:hypothetical protein
MSKICFEDGVKLKAFILIEILQVFLLIVGFIYSNSMLFSLGIIISVLDFIVFVSWLNSGWRR